MATSDVLTALYNVYTVKRSAIALASRRMTAAGGLIKALGGGRQASQPIPHGASRSQNQPIRVDGCGASVQP
jgi:outer membrane protein TolC